jgi:hypothetical protein
MTLRRSLILGFVAGCVVAATGQNPPSQNSPAQAPSSNDSSNATPAPALSALAGMQSDTSTPDVGSAGPQIPAILGGAGISAAFMSEMERSNYLRGGLNVGAVYDSNPLLLSSGAESNTSESVFPNIKIDESTSRMHWTLGYAGGLTVNQKFTSENQGSQNVNFDSLFRLSPHVNLRVAENFSMTTGFFDAGNGADAVPGAGGPNLSLITPLATQRSDMTTIETNYHFALNGLLGASGSFSGSHFSNVAGGAQLADTQTATGAGFWLHRIFREDWGGVSYRFDRITFDPNGEARVHSIYAVNTLSLAKRFTLSAFIGPQYSENQGLVYGALQPTTTNNWTVAGGAEVGWRDLHTGVSGGYSRSVSDGGGVLGAVLLQSIHGTFRRQLTPSWAGSVTATRGMNQSVTVPFTTSASSINLTSVGFSLERNVGKSMGLRMGYTHDFQEQYGLAAPDPTQSANRNRVFVTLNYQWAKPLGM